MHLFKNKNLNDYNAMPLARTFLIISMLWVCWSSALFGELIAEKSIDDEWADRVPFHVVDACGLGMFHRGEHVLKAVAKLMEEGLHLFKAHQAWNVSAGGV